MKIPRSKKDILVKTYLEYENYIKSLEEKYHLLSTNQTSTSTLYPLSKASNILR